MSIPSRLFHGHGKRKDPRAQEGYVYILGVTDFDSNLPKSANKEPPLRFPPPQSFIPLTSHKLGKQIGLLRPFYQEKCEKIRDSVPLPSAFIGQPPEPPPRPPVDDLSAPAIELADEGPNQFKTKMGPLGQISLTTGPTSKKKSTKASVLGIPPPSNTLTNGVPVPSPSKSETMPVTLTTFQVDNSTFPELSNGPGFAPNGITPSPVDVNGIAKVSAPPIPPPPNPSKKKKTKKDLNPPSNPNPKPPPFPSQPSLMVS